MRSTTRRSFTAKENTWESVAIERFTVAPLRLYSFGSSISPVFLSLRGLPRVKVSAASLSRACEIRFTLLALQLSSNRDLSNQKGNPVRHYKRERN